MKGFIAFSIRSKNDVKIDVDARQGEPSYGLSVVAQQGVFSEVHLNTAELIAAAEKVEAMT